MALSLNKKIMAHLTANLQLHPRWDEFETDLIKMCAKLPSYFHENTRQQAVQIIKDIEQFLISSVDIHKEDLEFLKEEIKFIDSIKQTSLFETIENRVDENVIKTFSSLSLDTEGIISLDMKFNFEQLKYISKRVFNDTGYAKFYISSADIYTGKIVSELFSGSSVVPIMDVLEDPTTGTHSLRFFSEKIPSGSNVVKRIEMSFYIYRFVSHTGEQMTLFSTEPASLGEAIVKGNKTTIEDKRTIGETATLSTSLPMFFVNTLQSRTPKIHTQKEFNLFWSKYLFSDWYKTPFIIENAKTKKWYEYKYTDIYKKLIWSWLVSAPIGVKQVYPLNLMIMGRPGTGKTDLIDNLHRISQESQSVFSGVSSTLLNLVPTFKNRPPEVGYLAKSNRFAFCDEFFRVLVRNGNSKNENKDWMGVLNDLLEQKKREVGSGHGRMNIKMTARVLATSNPVLGMDTFDKLLEGIDNAFLSRMLVYFQTEEDYSIVQKILNIEDLEETIPIINEYDMLGLIDYLQSVTSDYDTQRIEKIFNVGKAVLPPSLISQYMTRQKHHLECILDGVIKVNCMLDGRKEFKANEQDYEECQLIWIKILLSWTNNPKKIKGLPHKYKLKLLTQMERDTFELLTNNKGLLWSEIREQVKIEPNDMLSMIDSGLIKEIDTRYYTYENHPFK